MPILKTKNWYQSKTIWGAVFVIVFAIASVAGFDPAANPELMGKIYDIGIAVAAALGLYGLRDAIDEQRQSIEESSN